METSIRVLVASSTLLVGACGVDILEEPRCLMRESSVIDFTFDEDVGVPYTIDIETQAGAVVLECSEYPADEPHGGATVVESDDEGYEVGSVGGLCTGEGLSWRRHETHRTVRFDVRGAARAGAGEGTPVYRLRQATCHEVLDGEIPVATTPLDDV